MALSNFSLDGSTYLVVNGVSYAIYFKRETHINFHADLYADSSKTTLITSKEYHLHPELKIRELKGKVNELPTANLELGDLYLVKNHYLPHIPESWLLAKRKEPAHDNSSTDGWGFWLILPQETFLSHEKYYQITNSTTAILTEVEKPPRMGWKVADKGKGMSEEAKDIVTQCYLYLKSLPEYANAVDC